MSTVHSWPLTEEFLTETVHLAEFSKRVTLFFSLLICEEWRSPLPSVLHSIINPVRSNESGCNENQVLLIFSICRQGCLELPKGDFHAISPYGIKDLTPRRSGGPLHPDSSLHVSWNICLFTRAQCWWRNSRLTTFHMFRLGSSVLCHGVCERRWPDVPHSEVPSFWWIPCSLLRCRNHFCTYVPPWKRHHLPVSVCAGCLFWFTSCLAPHLAWASISYDHQLKTLTVISTEGPSIH